MAERRHGGRLGDARGCGRGGGCGDLPNKEVRDLQRDIEIGDLRRQVRDLQRREKRRRKSKPMRSDAAEPRSMDDPLFSEVFTSSDADEPSKISNSNIFSMSVYETPVYDEDILSMVVYDKPVYDEDMLSMPVYDEPVYDEDMLSMPVYDEPVYDEDMFYELPVLMSKSSPPSVKFDDVAEDEGVVVYDDEEYDEAEGEKRLLGFMFGNVDGVGDVILNGRRDTGIRKRKDVDKDVSQQFTTEELDVRQRMRNTPDFFTNLVNSIVPTIFGHQDIKRTILLMLMCGVHKVTYEGINLREGIIDCIMGDPSCAKSQFRKYTADLVPRSDYTSGKSSSGWFEDENFELKHDKEGYGLSWSAFKGGYLLSGSNDCNICRSDVSAMSLGKVLDAKFTYEGHEDY
ncbi:hypothetical protein SASPL_114336 [Salvia splendens]|uniref:MCM C-terminal AAA(+) ATPase domain-containing protein n=1 Tax=Salvia splendens TaxID=180675 RepID=A0A8X9A0L3_SALSN|nr:hypothetical protein SASPL_114336 [Salvia splendens]